MRTTTAITTAAAGVLAGLLLTGCGNTEEPAASSSKPQAKDKTESASPSPAETDDSRYEIGEAWEWDDVVEGSETQGDATVLGYEQPVKADTQMLPDGHTWAALEIKVCNRGGETFTVSSFPWALAYEDGTRIEASGSAGGDLPRPAYPVADAPVTAGDCVRGKVMFEVPVDSRPERVVYSSAGVVIDGDDPTEWMIPAA